MKSSKNITLDYGHVADKLKEVSFFEKYKNDERVIKKIISLCDTRNFKQGAKIIQEGDQGDDLFIILNGEIDIIKKTLQQEQYVVTTLSSAMGGIYVGELGLIDHDSRSATVEAKTDCECLVIKREKFLEFGNENPEIGLNITRAIAVQLSQKLRKSNTDLITLFSALVEEISGE